MNLILLNILINYKDYRDMLSSVIICVDVLNYKIVIIYK